MDHLISLLPHPFGAQLRRRTGPMPDELRMNVGWPLSVFAGGTEERFWPRITQEDLDLVLRSACRQSVYAHTETLRHGYVTVEGGHRVGICGFGVIQDGEVRSIRNISSMVIRVAKQILGCADGLLPKVDRSALLLGPPGSGKTTLLRDLVRQLSDKRHQRISLVDERGEVSAGIFGIPQLQIGARTDVLINIPKATAAMMMLRTMAPRWIAMDEITSKEDIYAMEQIAYCGVNILATAHGSGMEDLATRPLYRQMMQCEIFSKIIVLDVDKHYEVQEV